MKIKPLSDLHIDISPYQDIPLEDSKDTVLMLVGDICEVHDINLYEKFISTLCDNYKMVLIIFGNHEYYRGSIIRAPQKLKERLAKFDNVKVLIRESIVIEDVTFIGATLWTDMANQNPFAMWEAEKRMNDYRVIRTGSTVDPYKFKFKPSSSVIEHALDLMFIKNAVKNATTKKIVVMSHHAPCIQSSLDAFKGDTLNAAYYTPLEEYIYDSGITYWFHGHMHNSSDYYLENTRVIANPRGYGTPINLELHKKLIVNPELKGSIPLYDLYDNQNVDFNPNLIIEM